MEFQGDQKYVRADRQGPKLGLGLDGDEGESDYTDAKDGDHAILYALQCNRHEISSAYNIRDENIQDNRYVEQNLFDCDAEVLDWIVILMAIKYC